MATIHTKKTRERISKSLVKFFSGRHGPNYKGPSYINNDGYVMLRIGRKTVREHRMIMEKIIGRKLFSDEIVHHRDENKTNNKIDNLELISSSEHSKMHTFEQNRNRVRNSLGRFIS